mgnify:CR=1 FL=1
MRLDEIREIARIEADREDGYRHRINVCVAAGCLSCQSASVKDAFEKEIAKRGLENWCRVKGLPPLKMLPLTNPSFRGIFRPIQLCQGF